MIRFAGWLAVSATALSCAIIARAQTAQSVNDYMVRVEKLPTSLADFGFFTDLGDQSPSVNVTPYRLNTPLFSDGAEKLRFLYLPAGQRAKADGEGLLDLPVGAALIKTFAFGEGANRRLIETRVLLHRADGWLALPYKWNDAQTNATLAIVGAKVELDTPRGERISYRIPNKNQCKECHGLSGQVIPIGPKARNLSIGWLESAVAAGHLDHVPAVEARLPVWENRREVATAVAARAYLDINCAHCHRPGATASNSGLDLRWEQHDPRAIGIMKRPVAAGRGAGEFLFDIVPGDPDSSILVHRMSRPEPGVAMPELGKVTVDQDGVAEIRKWIAEMSQ